MLCLQYCHTSFCFKLSSETKAAIISTRALPQVRLSQLFPEAVRGPSAKAAISNNAVLKCDTKLSSSVAFTLLASVPLAGHLTLLSLAPLHSATLKTGAPTRSLRLSWSRRPPTTDQRRTFSPSSWMTTYSSSGLWEFDRWSGTALFFCRLSAQKH